MNLVITDSAFEEILSSGYKSALNGEKTSLKTKCKNGEYLSRAEDNIIYQLETLDYKTSNILDFVSKGDCRDVSWKRNSYSDHLGVEVNVGI